jgi:hypothetical protein
MLIFNKYLRKTRKPILLVIIGFSLIFTASCASSKESLPAWVSSPLIDNAKYLYGVGQGKSLQAANASALRNITTKLGVSISGVYKQRTVRNAMQDSTYVDDKIKINIITTDIKSYQQVKIETNNKNIYSLIKVERSILINDYKESFRLSSAGADKHIKDHGEGSSLAWWLRAQQLLASKQAIASQRYSSTLSIIDPFHELGVDESPWQILENLISKERNNVCLSIKSQDERSEKFVIALRTHLIDKGVRTSLVCKEELRASNTTMERMYFGMYVTRDQVTLKNNTGIEKTITLTSQSPTSYSKAEESNVFQLNNKLKDNYLWETLGFIQPSNQ